MREIDDGDAELVVTSPPYNVGLEYDEHDDSMEWDAYKAMVGGVFEECYRILCDGGRIAVVVPQVVDQPMIDLPRRISELLEDRRFDLRGHWIWHKKVSYNGTGWGSWRSASNPYQVMHHEHILLFNKGSWQRDGPQEMTKEQFLRNIKSVWTVPPVNGNDHPAEFPLEIPKRLIQLSSFEDDTVVDPFVGSGTTGEAAVKQKRNFIGYDISKDYCEMARNNIPDGDALEW